MSFVETVETDIDLIRALYQTRRKEVLYAEMLLATGQSAPPSSASTTSAGGTFSGGAGGFGDGGSGIIVIGNCFSSDTLIQTPQGEFNFREIYDRFTRGARKVYSFDNQGNVETDYIKNIWHHRAVCNTLVFENGHQIKVTPEHLLFPAFGEKKAARDFNLRDTLIFRISDSWVDLKLLDVLTGTEEEKVWNMRILKNKSYIAARSAASNQKQPEIYS